MKKLFVGCILLGAVSTYADTCKQFTLVNTKRACLKAKFQNPNANNHLLSACRQFSNISIIKECFQAIQTNHSVTYDQLMYCRRLSERVSTLEVCFDQLDNTNWLDL